MFYFGGALGVALFALWLYCILDVIASDETLIRNLPKILWLIIVIILPDVGSVAWLLLGRPPRAGLMPGDTGYRQPRSTGSSGSGLDHPSRRRPRAVGPEDSPQFMEGLEDRSARLRRWEEDLRRREDELRRREEGGDPA
jgi:hypothetical protein